MALDGTISRVDGLLGERRFEEAAKLLLDAAGAGETAAIAELAHWRIAGNLIRRDLAEARRLFSAAASQGDEGSALLHAAFLAAGVGGPDDWPGAVEALRALAHR